MEEEGRRRPAGRIDAECWSKPLVADTLGAVSGGDTEEPLSIRES